MPRYRTLFSSFEEPRRALLSGGTGKIASRRFWSTSISRNSEESFDSS
ncbi:hypothetical protein RB8670 [Rhodopirellula baltica SH 1]|uniref:Uncharacterized protein n=1 Tax=Rhodopirellula baltica (strain DSM 10527 / NCIMB 13988 / SH1) TaxID=243090 RepID=Q7UMQ8_RHOBA|nr:hypothetical protein RB8670 [Rhodopirellula baltica SH 1]